MKKFVGNAFSSKMVPGVSRTVRLEDVPANIAENIARGASSCVGHADTASVFSAMLGVPVPLNRVSVSLEKGDRLLIGEILDAQGAPVRLAPGATTLPEGAVVLWRLVTALD